MRVLQVAADVADDAVTAGLTFDGEGVSQLLLEPALFTVDVLAELPTATTVPVLPFSLSREYNALDLTLQIELFTALKRVGAAKIITYAAADMAETLHNSGHPTTTRNALQL